VELCGGGDATAAVGVPSADGDGDEDAVGVSLLDLTAAGLGPTTGAGDGDGGAVELCGGGRRQGGSRESMVGNCGARAGYGGSAVLRMEEWWGEARAMRGRRRLVRMGGGGTGGRRRLRRDWGAPRGCGQRETNDTDGPDQRRTTVKIDLRQNGWEAGYPYVLNK
jgi:hypothetical protein